MEFKINFGLPARKRVNRAFLTLAFDPMKDTVAALKAAGLDVKTMIGGGQIDDQIKEYTGADAWGRDAMGAVALVYEWIGG